MKRPLKRPLTARLKARLAARWSRFDTGLALPLLLAALAFVSALVVVRVKHQNRLLTTELESLRADREQLDMEWAQLRLEEAALAHHARVEGAARAQLGMAEPRDYVVIQQHVLARSEVAP